MKWGEMWFLLIFGIKWGLEKCCLLISLSVSSNTDVLILDADLLLELECVPGNWYLTYAGIGIKNVSS